MKILKSPSLLVFIFIAFLIGVPSLYISTQQESLGIQLLLFLVGSYGVSFAAFIALRSFHLAQESDELAGRLRSWRNSPMIYLAGIGIPAVLWLITAILGRLFSATIEPSWVGLAALPIIFITNLGEEIGWRGFALPRLLKSFSPLLASIVLGIIWGIFHIPLYWQRPVFAVLFLASTPALSIFITWLYLRTNGNLILITLAHASYNAWAQVFLTTSAERIMSVSVVVLWVFVGFLILRNGPGLLKNRELISDG